MRNYRNKRDIEAEILNIAKKGTKKTWIVYNANLNFKIAKKYIHDLIDRGLLELQKNIYFTTIRGIEYLEKIQEIRGY